MKKKDILFVAVVIALLIVIFQRPKETVVREIKTETKVVVDTIRDTVPVAAIVERVRVDTVKIPMATNEIISRVADSILLACNPIRQFKDSILLNIPIPIERKEYSTPNYYAVVEGYRPNLVRLDIYNKTHYTTTMDVIKQKKNYRLGIGLQTGYGYNGRYVKPYIGVGLHYNLIGF